MRRCGSRQLLGVIISVHEEDSVFRLQLRNGWTDLFINGPIWFEIEFYIWKLYKSCILIKIKLHATLLKLSAVAGVWFMRRTRFSGFIFETAALIYLLMVSFDSK